MINVICVMAQNSQLFELGEEQVSMMKSHHYLLVVKQNNSGFNKNYIYRINDMQLISEPKGNVVGITDIGYLLGRGNFKKVSFRNFEDKVLWKSNHHAVATVETPKGNIGIFTYIKNNRITRSKPMTTVYTEGVDLKDGHVIYQITKYDN